MTEPQEIREWPIRIVGKADIDFKILLRIERHTSSS